MWYKQNNFGISTWKSDTCQNYSIIQMHSKFYVRERSMQNDWNYVACANACDGFQSLIDAKQWISKNKSTYPEILCMTFSSTKNRTQILAANTKDLAANLSRVRSSNIWSYGFNMKDRHDKTGDIVVQFKNKNGGPGDVYIYYDVPFVVYRRWQSAPSKGHYFWIYIRNIFKYSKLTGDKRGKLKNAI